MKGHEVAVAWREHGGEPYHYSVMSYDERGRVEALLRYSESLGFDGVYYTYNSANLVTSVRVADPLRQHTTFYGYNYNGQVDSVWTHLEQPGSGVVKFTPTMRADVLQRPQPWNRYDTLGGADITYRYTPLGNVEQMKYPGAQITTDYWYNKRGWLDSLESQYTIVAPKIFQQKLSYDSVGRIVKQKSKNGGQGSWLVQGYEYDGVDRLQKWSRLGVGDTVLYEYDKVGNRTLSARIDGQDVRTYQYGAPTSGPNRLEWSRQEQGGVTTQTDYGYNLNGSIVERKVTDPMAIPLPTLLSEDHFGYSYRELNWKYQNGNPWETNHWDWRYRYNAQGEREQKRLYHGPLPDSIVGQPYPWVQYLLGGSKEQLAVWHGQQMSGPFCDTAWRRNVFLYPTEYLTNGIGWNGVHEDLTPIITKPDGSKEYRISDHLASLRASLTPGVSTKYYDYDPWGNVLGGGAVARRGFNENEKDRENGLFSLGVRKYEEGRFLSIDPLFEKEAEISPYVYAGNAPLNYVDPDGMQRRGVASVKGMALTVGDGLPEQLSAFGGAQGSGGMIVRVPGIGSGLSVRPSGGGGGVASSGNWIRVGQAPTSMVRFLQSSRGGVAAGAQSARGSVAAGAQSAAGASSAIAKPVIPNSAINVVKYANANNGAAQSGYKGNRPFANDGRGGSEVLPKTDVNGNAITYKEYDVNPYKQGANRGAERVVVGSDGKSYYTENHYQTFIKMP